MRRLLPFVVGTLFAIDCPAAEADPPSGEWQVTASWCRNCTGGSPDHVGSRLVLSASAASAELVGGACDGEVGYRRPAPGGVASRALAARIKPEWKSPSSGAIRWVTVTCDGLDFIPLAVLPDGNLAYFTDGDVAYRLVPATPAPAPAELRSPAAPGNAVPVTR